MLRLSVGMTNSPPPVPVFAEDAPWPERRLLLLRGAKLGAIVGIAAGLVWSGIPLCPVAILTGQPCPGCGLTRATFACLRLDFAAAVHIHPLVFFATPLVGYVALMGAWSFLKIGHIRYSKPISRWFVPPLFLLFCATFGLWIARFFGALGGPVPVTQSVFVRIAHLFV
ncbi:MAG: DUF2752 domain-containing protein [Polyangiaceae bacterium]